MYEKEATRYDIDHVRTHNEDLNVALILVRSTYLLSIPHLTRSQAGLLSAISSSFTVHTHSKLEPFPTESLGPIVTFAQPPDYAVFRSHRDFAQTTQLLLTPHDPVNRRALRRLPAQIR